MRPYSTSKEKINATVLTGPGCSLNSLDEDRGRFQRITFKNRGQPHDSLFLVEDGNPSNYHSEPIKKDLDYETIDEIFDTCPCHDPANAGKNLGRAGCLAVFKLQGA